MCTTESETTKRIIKHDLVPDASAEQPFSVDRHSSKSLVSQDEIEVSTVFTYVLI